MKNIIIPALLVFVAAAPTASAMDFETQVTSGRRWAETESDGETNGLQITEYNVAGYGLFHENIGAGPVFTYQQVRDVDMGDDSKMSFFKAGVEAYGRYEVNEQLTPYAKLRYSLYSKGTAEYDGEGNKATVDLETNGMNLTAGLKYNITKNFHVLGEGGMGVEMLRATKMEVELEDGTKLEDDEATGREDFNSKFVSLGVGLQF